MPESTNEFYERLADNYHLIFADWRKSVRWHGEVLDKIIRKEMGTSQLSVLDCSCGIGTQAIGLALKGHKVTGSDLSPSEIRRAKKEAGSFDVKVKFKVADMRSLIEQIKDNFDIVISCDNSLPHLPSDDDLLTATKNIFAKLREGGLFLASIRDYDAILREKLKSTQPQVLDGPDGRRIIFQVWDWLDDGCNYIFQLFLIRQIYGEWKTSVYTSRYRALLRRELSEILMKAGFSNIRWQMPDESGYFQPIVTARKL